MIKYIRMNFWPGRDFTDFEDMNRQLIVWRNGTANSREHRGTRRVIRLLFESDEKPRLLPLNPTVYDTDEIFSRHVSSDFHLRYESNRYSVPCTLVGMTVTVRVNGRDLKVYDNEKFICSHARSYLKNQVFTHEGHRAGLLERKPGATCETWQLGFVKNLGPKMAEYVELVRQGPRSLKYEPSRLVALDTQASNLFFQVISSRHDAELGTIATTNIPFGKFNQVFANDSIAHAIVDRLVNEAEVFYMEGDSYGATSEAGKDET